MASFLDPEIEEQLDRWVDAKRAKDFRKADAIRRDLRSQGIDPDTRRPSHHQPPTPRYNRETDSKLDAWVEAKRSKDFAKADALREELRAVGVEPDAARPTGYHSTSGSRQPHTPAYDVERRVDDWVSAKRNKDFDRADRIRAEMRQQGVDPDIARAKLSDRTAEAPTFTNGPPMQLAQMLQPALPQVQYLMPVQSLQLAQPVQAPVGMRRYDATVESKIDQWVAAKRAQDFGQAEQIRGELRMMGVEPDARPNAVPTQAPVPLTDDLSVEAQLDAWVAAKRSKDFETADTIRDQLRARGLDPDVLRPANGQAPPPPPMQAAAPMVPQFLPAPGPPPPPPPVEYVPKKNIVPRGIFDPCVEARLDEWVAAKRAKDFSLADRIRDELRLQGVEPDCARPSDRQDQLYQEQLSRGVTPAIAQPLDAATEAQLDEWVTAKRSKDYAKADVIRDRLRARGIEPDTLRPSHKQENRSDPPPSLPVPSSAPCAGDPGIEAQLDAWVGAKRMKDYERADAIRDTLRLKGIDPDTARPANGAAPEPQIAYIMSQHPVVQQQQQQPVPQVQYLMPASQVAAAQQPVQPLVSPAMVTPPPATKSTSSQPGKYDDATEARLDEWVAASRLKDTLSADKIREDLRAQGVDPETARPTGRARDTSNFEMSAAPVCKGVNGSHETWVQAKLDEWVQAKRDKSEKVDAIGAELRSRGIDPDLLRAGNPGIGLHFGGPAQQPPLMMQVMPQPVVEAGHVQYLMPTASQPSALASQPMGMVPSGQSQSMMMLMQQATAAAGSTALAQQGLGSHPAEPFAAIDHLQQVQKSLNAQHNDAFSALGQLQAAVSASFAAAPQNNAGSRAAAEASAPASKSQRRNESSYASERYSGTGGSGSGVVGGPDNPFHYDDYTEGQLDRWIAAKRAKDFATADAIRSELRARGIDPDIARPPDRR